MQIHQNLRRFPLPALTGIVLLVIYFQIAWSNDWFQLPNFNYMSDGNTHLFMMPPLQVASMLWKLLLLLPASLLLAWALSATGFSLKLPRFVRNRHLPLLLSVLAALIITGLILFVFRATEVTDDELAYVFQAKTYLAGRLFNPPPPSPLNFFNVFIINKPAVFVGMYQFGHPLVLAIGMMLGSEYIITVFLSAAFIVLLARIARDLFDDDRLVTVSSLLLFISPFFYLISSSRLSQTTTAFCFASFFILFLKIFGTKEEPTYEYSLSFLAGLLAGFAANIRPLTAIAFLLPFLILILYRLYRNQVRRPLAVVFMGAGFLVMILLTLVYDKLITGNYFMSPITFYDPAYKLGFRPFSHTIGSAIQNLGYNVGRMNAFLFGFPASLLFTILIFFRRQLELGDRLALSILACFAVAYLFWWIPGVSDLGPTLYYECIIPLVLLSGRGFLWLHDLMKSRFPAFHAFPTNFLVISVLLSLLTFVPERMTHISRLTRAINEPYAAIQEHNIHNSVVFIFTWPNQGWVFGYRNNSPNFDNDVVLCRYAKAESNARVLEHFKDRDTYILISYGSPKQYDLRKVTRQQLLSTDWEEVFAQDRARDASPPR
jgi:hypothetical protein